MSTVKQSAANLHLCSEGNYSVIRMNERLLSSRLGLRVVMWNATAGRGEVWVQKENLGKNGFRCVPDEQQK